MTTFRLWIARMRHPRLVLVLAVCVLIAAVVTVVQLTSTSARATRTTSPGTPARAPARASAPAGSAAAIRAQAAAWIAGQVGSDQSIACDPLMCKALGADGVTSGRLVALGTTTAANVLVTSPADHTQTSQDMPVLLASFGAGDRQIEVRAAAPAGYAQALAADLSARRSGGAQLLHSQSIQAGATAAAQLRSGQVDSRLLIMLALLASEHSWKVVAFGGASPGVPLADAPLREVVIAGTDAKAVAGALTMIRAQRAPYAPAQASQVQLPGGQPGIRIDFAAPGPLGLLTGTAVG